MPTLAKEHNSTLLGRVSHTYSFNDERGIQFELNGSIMDLAISMQYAHLSRNEKWRSNSENDWTHSIIDNYLPSSDFSALPYWENYNEISGYTLNERLYFKIGHGINREIIKNLRNFIGYQKIFQVLILLTLRYMILLSGMVHGTTILHLFLSMILYLPMNMMLNQNYGSRLNHSQYQ